MVHRAIVVAFAAAIAVAWSGGVAAAERPDRVKPKASEGCGAAPAPLGETQVATTSGGTARSYFRFVPTGYDGTTPFPLVLDVHGTQEPALVHKQNSALGPFGDEHGFITITPEGSGPPAQWDTHIDSADMKFLIGLLDEVERQLCVDTRRVFVAGYSNGAMVASVFACELSDRIAAIAPVAGIRNPPDCKPDRRVPIVAFHGTGDEWISYDGGLGPKVFALSPAESQALVDIAEPTSSDLSIPEVAGAWAKRNGCRGTPKEQTIAPDVTLIRYQCRNHADVQLYEIKGAGHTWPGAEFSRGLVDILGPTTYSIDADAVMWKFFQQHPFR